MCSVSIPAQARMVGAGERFAGSAGGKLVGTRKLNCAGPFFPLAIDSAVHSFAQFGFWSDILVHFNLLELTRS